MRAVLVLIQRSQPQRTNVAGDVVAWPDRVVADGVGADEADLDIAVGAVVLCVVLDLEVQGLSSLWWPRFFGWWLGGGILGIVGVVVVGSSPAPPSAAGAVSPATASSTSSAPASLSVAPGSRRRYFTAAGCWRTCASGSHAGVSMRFVCSRGR